jgi:hypothetical protein
MRHVGRSLVRRGASERPRPQSCKSCRIFCPIFRLCVRMPRFVALVLALAFLTHPADAAEVSYPPGSRIGLVPPTGMVASKNFFGFEDPTSSAAIAVVSLPAEAFAALDGSMNAGALKRQGLTLEKREALSLSTGKAFLVVGRQEIENIKVRKWVLVGATQDLTALVTVQVPEAARPLYPDAAIRAALETLAIRASVPIEEQLGLLPFKLGDLAGFRVEGVIPGRAVVLTDTSGAAGQPAQIFINVAPGGPEQTSQREAFARDVFAAVPNIRDVRISTAEPLRIIGHPGHQIMAQGRDVSGTLPLTLVQWLRFGGGAYLQIIGVSRTETWLDAYPRFRAVRDGIEPR